MRFESHRTSRLHRAIWATKPALPNISTSSSPENATRVQGDAGQFREIQGLLLKNIGMPKKANSSKFILGNPKLAFWDDFPWRMIDTEYDRAKVPPYNGSDPPPAPGRLKALLFPPLLNKVQSKGMRGVQARYGAELPPLISIVWHPGPSSHIGHGDFPWWMRMAKVDMLGTGAYTTNSEKFSTCSQHATFTFF